MIDKSIKLVENQKKCLKYASKIKNRFYGEFMEDQINSFFEEDEISGVKTKLNSIASNIEFIISDAIYDDCEYLSEFLNLTKKLMKIRFTLNHCIGLHERINRDIKESIKTDSDKQSKKSIKINIEISHDKDVNYIIK